MSYILREKDELECVITTWCKKDRKGKETRGYSVRVLNKSHLKHVYSELNFSIRRSKACGCVHFRMDQFLFFK